MINARVAGLCLALGLFGAPAMAQAAECETYEAALQEANGAHGRHPGSRLTEFSGADAQKIMDVINAMEPVTDFKTDRFLVLEIPEQSIVAFGYMRDGCFRGPSQASLEEWRALHDQAFGSKS